MAKLGVLTSGGDAPGLNPAIKWVVKHSLDDRVADNVIGIKYGWKGILDAVDVVSLNEQTVRTWDRDGGTHLGSSRTNPFDSQGKDKSEQLLRNVDSLGIDFLIAMGGDDTLSVAAKLHQKGVKIVGIPKTIDGDVRGTDYSLGLASAVEKNRQVLNDLRNPAGSHGIIYIVEVMGRDTGHLALYSGIAGAAAIILIPEYPFALDHVALRSKERRKNGARYDIVVVSEGAKTKEGTEIGKEPTADDFGHKLLGGIGDYLAEQIQKLTGYETRGNRPGHVQRGAPPNFYDVIMGRLFGIGAVELIKDRRFGYMVSLKEGKISATPLEEATKGKKFVDVDRQYDTQKLNAKRSAFEFPLF